MQFPQAIKTASIVAILSTMAVLDLASLATANSATGRRLGNGINHDNITVAQASRSSGRRRLNFRLGVRPVKYRAGGFSRAAACDGGKAITALVPPLDASGKTVTAQSPVDRTTNEHPTFLVNVPALTPTTAQFTLQDESAKRQLHSVTFNLTGKPGIVAIAMPASAPKLEVGQKYLWQLSVACDPDDPASNIVVSGWIERIAAPNVPANGDRLAVLAEQGIWQDIVSTLAVQRFKTPDDTVAAADWADLMDDVRLPQFKTTPVIQIVTTSGQP